MFKRILSFSLLFLLAACAGGRVKEIPPDVHDYKRVDFFIQGRTQAAFKVIGQMNQDYLEGVLRIKKIGDQDFDVLLMTGAAYRLLHATVSPQGVAYRYLFKDADTSLVRDRITQFLNLLLSEPGVFQNRRFKDGAVILTYKGRDAKEKFFYQQGESFPYAAQSIVMFNTGDLSYGEYAPFGAAGTENIPHTLIYKDGNVTLDMTLISLR